MHLHKHHLEIEPLGKSATLQKTKKLENWKILVISEDTLSRSLTIFFFDYISIISMYKYSRSQNDKDTKMTVPHFEWPPVQINVWLTSEARATKVASFSSNWKGKSFTSNFPIAHCHACFLSFNQIQSASKVVISKAAFKRFSLLCFSTYKNSYTLFT